MEEKSYKIDDVLEITIGILEKIPITAKEAQTIGAPIMNAVHNLEVCRQAIAAAEAQASLEAVEKAEGQEDERNADAE